MKKKTLKEISLFVGSNGRTQFLKDWQNSPKQGYDKRAESIVLGATLLLNGYTKESIVKLIERSERIDRELHELADKLEARNK